MSSAHGDAVVAVVLPLTQQAGGLAVAQHRDEQPHVLAVGVRGQGLGGLLGRLGQVLLGLGRDDEALDGQRDAVDVGRPGQPAEQRLQGRGVRQALLLDRGEGVAGRPWPAGPAGAAPARPARPCGPARTAAAAGPSRRTATCRSVSRAAVTRGLKIGCGALVTAPMLPYRRRRGGNRRASR